MRGGWRCEEKEREEHEEETKGGQGTERDRKTCRSERPCDKELTKFVISINIENITARSVHSCFILRN